MQILLRTGTKPNLYLVKRLIPLTHWGHLNNSNESVLDLLDVSSKRHSEIAPYIINTIYAYVMNRPDVSRNEDITKQSGHSISPRKDDKVKKSLSAGAVLEEPAKEKITSTELLLKKYNIVQAYIKDKVKGRR
ncbi:hypothetical protein Noda2021_00430 [Candidatus Dependentiae bacterium Noda2021]|nr:hypothetical protein Noda2021_00430 [Candidatus Dependentiae bacterium Noda2021]